MLVPAPLSEVMGQDLYQSYRKARSMNGWGIALTVVGSVATVYGGAGLISASIIAAKQGMVPNSSNVVNFIIGGAVTGAGVAMLACGIPMITIGKKRLKNIVAEFNLASTQNGVGLTMNF